MKARSTGWIALILSTALWISCAEEEILEGTLLNCAEPDTFVACGGDLTGLWQATSACITEGNFLVNDEICGNPNITFEVGITGGINFLPDGMLDASVSVRQRSRATISKACLPDLAMFMDGVVPETCSEIVPSEPIDICADRGDECLCSGSDVGTQINSGTYQIAEPGVVTLLQDDGTEARLEYCVNGRFLDMRLEQPSPLGTTFTIVSRWLK